MLAFEVFGERHTEQDCGLIGKPLRTDRATAQKDIIEYAPVLVEVSIDQNFLEEISFVNEKGVLIKQQGIFECKPIICGDCAGIGPTQEECRKKKYEVALRKIRPKQV